MTTEEKERARAFAACRFPAGSFVKRFAREIGALAKGSGNISERQAARLLIEAYRYRRQMPEALVPAEPPAGYETTKQRSQRTTDEFRLRQDMEKKQPPVAGASQLSFL